MVFKRLVVVVLTLVLLFGCAAGNEADPTATAYATAETQGGQIETRPPPGVAPQIPDNQPEEPAETSAATPDFSAISGLNGKAHGWGHGGPVDAQNRSVGALQFQERYGNLDAHFIRPDSQQIYLTFDQGYEYGFTPIILDTLRERGVVGTFFLTMHFVETHPELVQRMIDEGHILANHSTRHRNFPSIGLQEAMDDVMELHNYVMENHGVEMHLFRFPEGSFSEQMLALMQNLGYSSVFWSMAYRDWERDNQPLTIDAVNRLVAGAHPGAIYLLHSVSRTNSEVLGEVIDLIREQGFEFGRLDIPPPQNSPQG